MYHTIAYYLEFQEFIFKNVPYYPSCTINSTYVLDVVYSALQSDAEGLDQTSDIFFYVPEDCYISLTLCNLVSMLISTAA